jgi:hypothetical protein
MYEVQMAARKFQGHNIGQEGRYMIPPQCPPLSLRVNLHTYPTFPLPSDRLQPAYLKISH